MKENFRIDKSRWEEVRRKVFERDNFTCQICLSKKVIERLHPHHLWFKNKFEDYYNPKKITTLCRIDHKILEKNEQRGKFYKMLRDIVLDKKENKRVELNEEMKDIKKEYIIKKEEVERKRIENIPKEEFVG